MMKNFRGLKLAVIAHDAGAANHILSWAKNQRFDIASARFCLKGPAQVIAKRLLPEIKVYDDIESCLEASDFVIAGSGWASDLEYSAMQLAKTLSIKVVTVIDHWVNYRERLHRHDQMAFPDEIWVTDAYALSLVKKYNSRVSRGFTNK